MGFIDRPDSWWSEEFEDGQAEYEKYSDQIKTILRGVFSISNASLPGDINIQGIVKLVDSIIVRFGNIKKFLKNKLYAQVKTHTFDVYLPGREKGVFDELTLEYKYNGKKDNKYVG